MSELGKFQLTVMDPDSVIYKKDVSTVFVTSERGEFELLAYHYPVLCLIKEDTNLIIDWQDYLTVKKGILKFFKNECVLILELADDYADYFVDLFVR